MPGRGRPEVSRLEAPIPESGLEWRRRVSSLACGLVLLLGNCAATSPEAPRGAEAGPRFEGALAPRLRGDLVAARRARLEGNFEGAEAEYGEVLYQAPVDLQARLGRGMARLGQGDLAGARADFEAVTFLAPEYGDAWLGLARLLERQGDLRGARQALDRASSLSADEARTLLASAWIHSRVGEQDAAHRDLVAAVQVGADPDQVAALWNQVFAQDPSSPEVRRRARKSPFWEQRHLPTELRQAREDEEWEIRIGREWERYDQNAGYQVTDQTRITRKTPGRAVVLEHLDRDRFARRDNGLALEVHQEIREGTFARARVQVTADAEVLPKLEYRGALHRDLGRGLHAELGLLRAEVPGEDLEVYHFEIGRVIEDWYLRYRSDVAPFLGSTAWMHGVWARRFLEKDADHFLELGIRVGEEVTESGAGPTLVPMDATLLELRYQRFLNERFGVYALASTGSYESLPDYHGLMLGLLVRWW